MARMGDRQRGNRETWVVTRGATDLGNLRIVDGALRWGGWTPRGWSSVGTLTLVEQHGAQYLTWQRNDGTVLAEVDRTK
jgi:hypothetical protein